jgi:hypothetical protein
MWGTEMGNASLIRERATWTRASLQDEGCQADEHFSCLFPAPRGRSVLAGGCAQLTLCPETTGLEEDSNETEMCRRTRSSQLCIREDASC